jgi:hypothetical protein
MAYVEIGEDGERITPARLRAGGLRGERDGQILLRYAAGGGKASERLLRAALGDLVDAFLIDRVGQADLFARAHVLGADLHGQFGCSYEYKEEEDTYSLRCPVFALHQTFAFSVAWTLITRGSICGAGAFECDHVSGRTYAGAECRQKVEKVVGFPHVALTADPDFLHTWHQPIQAKGAQLVAEGKIRKPGDEVHCKHCAGCLARLGPTEGDLDPVGRFSEFVAENRPA